MVVTVAVGHQGFIDGERERECVWSSDGSGRRVCECGWVSGERVGERERDYDDDGSDSSCSSSRRSSGNAERDDGNSDGVGHVHE